MDLIKLLGYAKAMGGYAEYKRRYDNKDTARLQELNGRVRTMFFVRRLKADVLTDLPPKLRSHVPLDICNRAAYAKAEQDVAAFFATKKSQDAQFLRDLTEAANATAKQLGIDAQEIIDRAVRERYNGAYLIAAQNERLLRWEALKQLAVAGKMPAVYEWIEGFLENSDQKLVLFGSHTKEIEAMSARYAKEYGAVHIHGGVEPDDRMPLVDRFQNDAGCRLIIGNMIAMGEGLTLTAASNVAFFEFGWNPKTHDQAEDRCHRIGQRDNVTVWNLVGADTIDEEIALLIDDKRMVINAIQDGAGADNQAKFMADLEDRLNKRRRGEVTERVDPTKPMWTDPRAVLDAQEAENQEAEMELALT